MNAQPGHRPATGTVALLFPIIILVSYAFGPTASSAADETPGPTAPSPADPRGNEASISAEPSLVSSPTALAQEPTAEIALPPDMPAASPETARQAPSEPPVPPSGSEPPAETSASPAAPRAHLVTFELGITTEAQLATLAAVGVTPDASIPALRMHAALLSAEAASALQADPSVTRLDLDRTREAGAAPSDTFYGEQWSLPQVGWDQLFGTVTISGSATIALLDTGVDSPHPDLDGVLVSGTSILDDSDGLTDANGHGTWMAGILGAETDNAYGIAGTAYAGVSIMPVTVLNADGLGRDSDIIAGVVYAADNGADVILMAFSNPGYSAALQAAIDYAWARRAVIVAATGNDGLGSPTFPAGNRGVIGVASTDASDALALGSNFGPAAFMAAPGVDILTTSATGGVASITGTSAAAAQIAGAAALLRANDPLLTNGVIVSRLARTADPVGDPGTTGNGRLNLARAMADASTDSVQPAGAAPVDDGGPPVGPYAAAACVLQPFTVGPQTPSAVVPGSSATFSFTLTKTGGPCGPITLTASPMPVGADATFAPNPVTFAGSPSSQGVTLTITTTALTPVGDHSFTVTADGPNSGGQSIGADQTAPGVLVVRFATTTTITSDSPDPSYVGQPYTVSWTVTVNPPGSGTPSGLVTVSDGSVSCSAAVAVGGCALTSTSAGAKTLTATYAGDATFSTSSDTEPHTVAQRSTSTLVSCDSPVAIDQASTCTVTVTDTDGGSASDPTGTVDFSSDNPGGGFDFSSCALAGNLDGSSTCTVEYSGDAAQTDTISATYTEASSAIHATSSDSDTILVAQRSTSTLVSCDSPVAIDQASTCTVTVTDTDGGSASDPTGTVDFSSDNPGGGFDFSSCALAGNLDGSSTCTVEYSGDAAQTDTISATYTEASSAIHATSSDSDTILVAQRSTSTTITFDSPDPSYVGQPYTVSWTVTVNPPGSGTPSGLVTVSDGSVSCSAAVAVGGCALTSTSAGAKTLTATYAGDATFSTSSDTEPHQVNTVATTPPTPTPTPTPTVTPPAPTGAPGPSAQNQLPNTAAAAVESLAMIIVVMACLGVMIALAGMLPGRPRPSRRV